VKDLDRALEFYRDTLGLKVFKIVTIKGKYPEQVLNIKGIELTYAKLRTPGQSKNSPAIFELHYWRKPKIRPRKGYNHMSFTVRDIDGVYKRLSKSGIKFISVPRKSPAGYTKVCFAYDPDNNLIEFVEDLRGPLKIK
jgi:catechol 2,3-dioxygenase-like lactoylglutathione lyase family enzyme